MNITVHKETAEHHLQVREILRACFESDSESMLVELLREHQQAVISLVAVCGDEVCGHVMFSPVTTEPTSPARGLGLAPLAVKASYQKQGIGARLVQEGLRLSKEMGYEYVVVLGDPKYYQRFGFEKASQFGIQNEYGADDAFMFINLTGCVLQAGLVKYCPEFAFLSV